MEQNLTSREENEARVSGDVHGLPVEPKARVGDGGGV